MVTPRLKLETMSGAKFWDNKFQDEEGKGQSQFGGEPNPTVASIIDRIGQVYGLTGESNLGFDFARKSAMASAGIAFDETQLPPAPTGTFRYPPRALDLGSGRGRHLVWLASQGWDATGLDFSAVGLAHTEKALTATGLRANLLQSDFTSWHPEPSSYELVLAAFIHQNRPEQSALWKAVEMAITPGGFFVSVSHHPENQSHGPKDPERLYTPEEVVTAFGAGFAPLISTRLDGADGSVDAVVVLRKNPG